MSNRKINPNRGHGEVKMRSEDRGIGLIKNMRRNHSVGGGGGDSMSPRNILNKNALHQSMYMSIIDYFRFVRLHYFDW